MSGAARPDGRGPAQLRPLELLPDYLEQPHGSLLYAQGKTKVLCTASIQDGVPRWLYGKGRGWLTAEYSLLPASTGERTDREAARGKQGFGEPTVQEYGNKQDNQFLVRVERIALLTPEKADQIKAAVSQAVPGMQSFRFDPEVPFDTGDGIDDHMRHGRSPFSAGGFSGVSGRFRIARTDRPPIGRKETPNRPRPNRTQRRGWPSDSFGSGRPSTAKACPAYTWPRQ